MFLLKTENCRKSYMLCVIKCKKLTQIHNSKRKKRVGDFLPKWKTNIIFKYSEIYYSAYNSIYQTILFTFLY